MNAIKRHAVRALLLAQDHILLIKTFIPDSNSCIWLTPGGGVEPGEDPRQALYREVFEETGLQVSNCRGPVWLRQQQFVFNRQHYDQREDFYLVPTERFEPQDIYNPAAGEKEIFRGFKWWPLDAISAACNLHNPAGETFVPRDLHVHLTNLRHTIPEQPLLVGE